MELVHLFQPRNQPVDACDPLDFRWYAQRCTVIGTMCLITPEVHPFTEVSSSSISGIAQVIYIGLFWGVAGYLLWLNGYANWVLPAHHCSLTLYRSSQC